MKKITYLLLLLNTIAFAQIEKSVCFIGNSYTYSNDLPGLVAQLATADGNTLIKDQNTPGGYTLEGHSSNATTISKIMATDWDFVVLQDQSQRPSFPWDQVNEEVIPFAKKLCDTMRYSEECTIPVFFSTWGRRDGDDQWDSINTFTKMNSRLQFAYDYMADANSGKLSPVGVGFEHIANDATSPISHAALYVGDGSHPSIYGSYLAACIFYEVIFETSPIGNTYNPGAITAGEASYLQDVAHHVITDVDSITVDYTEPEASFIAAHDGLTVTYTNTSLHAFSYLWDFGDGTTSTEVNPVHTYADEETYTTTLTATYCDRSDIASGDGDNSGIKKEEFEIGIYPVPSNGEVTISYNGGQKTGYIFDVTGKLIQKLYLDGFTTIELERGTYILRVENMAKQIIVH